MLSGSALEALHDDALYKYTFTLLTYLGKFHIVVVIRYDHSLSYNIAILVSEKVFGV